VGKKKNKSENETWREGKKTTHKNARKGPRKGHWRRQNWIQKGGGGQVRMTKPETGRGGQGEKLRKIWKTCGGSLEVHLRKKKKTTKTTQEKEREVKTDG